MRSLWGWEATREALGLAMECVRDPVRSPARDLTRPEEDLRAQNERLGAELAPLMERGGASTLFAAW